MFLTGNEDTLSAVGASLPAVFRAIDLTGVFMNGILGGRLAREKGFDAVGFAVLSVMSALGGGVIRDVMLQAGPPVALTDRYYLITALAGSLVAFLWRLDGKWTRRALLFFDAMVLGTWAATGASKALALGFAVLPSILMGIVTAIGGGMVRDIAAGNVPIVFGGNNLYATPAAASAIVDTIIFQQGYPMLAMLVATVFGSSFTVVASWRRWVLPQSRDWTISMTPKQWKHTREKRRRRRGELSPPLRQTQLLDGSGPVSTYEYGAYENTPEQDPDVGGPGPGAK